MAGVLSFFLRTRLGSEGVMQRLPFLVGFLTAACLSVQRVYAVPCVCSLASGLPSWESLPYGWADL